MAVVSQPKSHNANVPAPGVIDEKYGEFWPGNAVSIPNQGHNLSAYERKRTFLNARGRDFLDVSYVSGADNDGDGRTVVAADFRNDGHLDLLERNFGGGPLHLYENQMPARHYLEVSLRGARSHRQGLGARLFVEAGGVVQVREVYPASTFHSEAPLRAHFGLGEARRVDRLIVRWPAGQVQVLSGLAADRHIVVDEDQEGPAAVKTVVPGVPY